MKRRIYEILSDLFWKLGFEETSFKMYLLSLSGERAPEGSKLPPQAMKRHDPELDAMVAEAVQKARKSGEPKYWN